MTDASVSSPVQNEVVDGGTSQSAPADAKAAAPGGLVSTAISSSQIKLSWTDNSNNESGFKIERAPATTGPWAQIATTAINVSYYTNSGLAASTRYYYRVRATLPSGNSSYTNATSSTTFGATLSAPSYLSASVASSSRINLSWTDGSSNETGFKVERAPSSSGAWVQVGTTGTNVASFADTTTAASTTYYYRVRATATTGDSTYSNTAYATTPAATQTAPAAPSYLSATAISASQINLSFSDNASNETGFKVERAPSSTGAWVQIGTTGTNGTSFPDTSVAGSTTYYYRVRATSTAGDSGYSNTASTTTPAAAQTLPTAPSLLSATAISSSQINVSWSDNSSNDTGFKVERAPSSSGAWVQIGTTGTNVASYADNTAAASTTYYYRVRATNTAGDSGYSNVANGTSQGTTLLGSTIWSKQLGATKLTDASYVTAVAADASGNIFTAGRFTGAAELGSGVVPGGVGYDLFVAKYDSNGTYKWAKHFNSANVQSKTAAMAVDSGGNVLLTGSFFNTLDFGAPCAPITAYSQDTFIVKLSSTGSCVWARSFTSNNVDAGGGLAVDASNNVVVAGGFQGTLDFGNSVILTGHGSGQSDIYLAKFNSSGGIVWAHNYSGTTNNAQMVYDVAIDDSGNIAMTGSFQSTVDFCAPGPACRLTAAVNPVSGPSNDAFIVKYTPGGAAIWARSFGESQGVEQVGQAVAFDDAGNLLVTGFAAGDLDFGTGIQRRLGATDLYVAKLAPGGTTVWAKRFGYAGYDQYAFDLAVDASNDVVVAAKTSGPIDFGGGVMLNPDGFTGRTNALGLKLTSTGDYAWSKSWGDNWFQSARAVTTDGSRNVIFTGVFASTVDFGTGTLTSPGASTDCIFLVKLRP